MISDRNREMKQQQKVHFPNEKNNTEKIIQRQVEGWEGFTVSSGTVVFHNTSPEHANNIVDYGIQNVDNAWGGGLLGAGFYTYATQEGVRNW